MALPDLTGQNIQNTYQRVLQTDGINVLNGTGSLFIPPTASYAVTASYVEITQVLSASYAETASYAVSASHEIIKEVSSSYADYAKESGLSTSSISASYASTASYALNSPDPFPYTGSAVITGSLTIEGPLTITGSQLITEDIISSGTLRARVKSFDIEHPTKLGKRLVYGALEGPEHGVYCRGKSNVLEVKLPPEWSKLIVPTTVTVQISSIGKFQPIYFKEFINNWLYFGCDSDITEYDFFWEAKGVRADVPKLRTTQ
mgnify:CR=1 FL=1|tara:strand:+ start:2301 stop:3080 length:780 start_codon:yes stop_codon:yes gene_type:complete